jgi:uncharacterized membrane protein
MHKYSKQLSYQRGILYGTAVSFGFLFLRIIFSGEITYTFLVWNLLLAAVPYYLVKIFRFPACRASAGRRESKNPIALITILSLWLLFLPNAPYILTDFIHLQFYDNPYCYLDIAILSSFSLSGMLMALSSLNSVIDFLKAQEWITSRATSVIFKMGVVSLCALGVYLGRILRWNSWNILNRPRSLASDLLQLFIHPLEHRESWAFITIFCGLLIILSLTIEKLIHATSKP